MDIEAGVGFSEHRHPSTAVREAFEQARTQLTGRRIDFAMVFVTVGHRLSLILDALTEPLDDVPFIGCTAEGIISSAGITEGTHGIAVALFRSDRLRFVPFGVGGLRDSAEGVGHTLGQHLAHTLGQGGAKGLLALPDGLAFNFDAFMRGLSAHVSGELPLVGGMAGDNWRFAETRQFHGRDVFTDGIVGALLVGDVQLHAAVTHGMAPLGNQRTVTRATGNVIEEVDGKPALGEIKAYLGFDLDEADWARGLTELAVGLRRDEPAGDDDDLFTIRFMPVIDEERGTVTIPTEIAPGEQFWIMRRDVDRMREGVDRMIHKLKLGLDSAPPAFVLHFDCAGRGKVFLSAEEKAELLDRLRSGVADDAPWIGMYSYGELAPVEQENHYHSYTAAVVAVR
ncbi:MAG: FIST N-terminal domain-containing protein [Myxococcota bacterium]